MNNKVWILTSGYYSDYHIIGVFSSSQLAEKVRVNAMPDDTLHIDEWNVDTIQPPPGMHTWSVVMRIDNGSVCSVGETEIGEEKVYMNPGGPYLIVHCWACNEEHAIKIATEQRQEYIAKQLIRGLE